METLEKITGMVGILINAVPSKEIRDTFKAASVLRDTEKEYFGKALDEKERQTKYQDHRFRLLVKKNLEKKGLGSYYNFG